MYHFYYVSLSDGDASLRIRTLYAENQNNKKTTHIPHTKNIPCSTLHFIISGNVSVNGQKTGKGYAFYSDACSKHNNIFSLSKDATLLTFTFDGIHHRKLISDVNINYDSLSYPIEIYNFDEIMNIYHELLDMYPKNAPVDPPQMLTQISAKQYFYRVLHSLEDKNILLLDTSRRQLLVDAESYMRNHFNEEITIENVSDYLLIDRRYLYKLFKKFSGISPKQYLNNIRISRATELLSDSDLSVKQIAEAVGYKDSLQFSAFFKKQTGFSPKKYRESH